VRRLVARAPTRIDFGGGWTDVPPYSEEQGGCVCNLAIARHSTVEVAKRGRSLQSSDAPPGIGGVAFSGDWRGDSSLASAAVRRAGIEGIALTMANDFPMGAGLGGSSSAGVALVAALAAWRGEKIDRAEMAERSRRLEVEDLRISGGRQDHYAAAFGGALGLSFSDRVEVRQLSLSASLAGALERQCVIVYTGQSRVSAETITAVLDAYRAGTRGVASSLARMKELAQLMIGALERENVEELGALVGEHWVHQRTLHPGIPTPTIDALIDRTLAAGALGAKALGASGGGCVLIIAAPNSVEPVRATAATLGEVLPFTIDTTGVRIDANV
jgi:D-glycero-alpha-D-manno-heptose-7-phosphate kinase